MGGNAAVSCSREEEGGPGPGLVELPSPVTRCVEEAARGQQMTSSAHNLFCWYPYKFWGPAQIPNQRWAFQPKCPAAECGGKKNNFIAKT